MMAAFVAAPATVAIPCVVAAITGLAIDLTSKLLPK
jgi:hypothetical protein